MERMLLGRLSGSSMTQVRLIDNFCYILFLNISWQSFLLLEHGVLKLEEDERILLIDARGQPCNQFAIHENLPIVEELYNSGELSFFVKAGVLDQPVTKSTFEALTETQLFAHNHMQIELQQFWPLWSICRNRALGAMREGSE